MAKPALLAVLIGGALLLPLLSPAQAQTCNGLAATIIGTAGNDEIAGTNGDDVIVGLGGDDNILGGAGNDTICGGDGNDNLRGEGGDDTLLGEADDDVLIGDDAASVGGGTDGNDSCDGGSGIDTAGLLCEITVNIDVNIFPVTVEADDGVQLDGALYVPIDDAANPAPRDLAVLVSHGAMGSFEFSVPKLWGLWGSQNGFTVLALNRRDFGPTGGGGTVVFEDATADLGPGIDLLNDLGYQSVFVTGHSQGTQNAAIYPVLISDSRVAAVGLYGTVDDGRSTAQNLLFNELILGPDEGYSGLVTLNEQLIADGEGDILRDYNTIFGVFLTRTPNNWMSFWGPNSLSVVEREITNLTIPALLMRADGDAFKPDVMSQNVLAAALGAGVDATYILLPYLNVEGNPIPLTANGGNAHGFAGVERQTIGETLNWLTGRVPASGNISIGNLLPVALTPPTQPVTAMSGDMVQLDGTTFEDVDGSIASYMWMQTGGAAVQLDDPTIANPSFTAPNATTMLTFSLTVMDNDGESTVAQSSVMVMGPAGPAPITELPGGSNSLDLAALLLLLFIARRRGWSRTGRTT